MDSELSHREKLLYRLPLKDTEEKKKKKSLMVTKRERGGEIDEFEMNRYILLSI